MQAGSPSLLFFFFSGGEPARRLMTGIRWDLTRILEDIDYADDLPTLTSRADQAREERRQGRNEAEPTDGQMDESREQEQRGTESKRQHGGGGGQFHLPGGASVEGRRGDTGQKEEGSTGVCKL